MTSIERHCRLLLLAYPRWYRTDRGDEIVGTLLETAAPGRTWPSVRDTRALIAAGLRVRAGLGERLTTAANLTQALLLAVVLELATYSAMDLGFARGESGTFPFWLFAWINLALGLATLAAMAGAWYGPPKVVAGLALVTAGLWLYQPPDNQPDQAIPPVLALALIAILALRRQRLPRPWLWLATAWYLAFLARWLFPVNGVVNWLAGSTPFIILAAAIAWCALDVRPMFAIVLIIAIECDVLVIRQFVADGARTALSLWPYELGAATSAALILVAIWRLRRQAVL